MIKLKTIQERLAYAIRQSQMTQAEIANRLGIKQPTVGQYLSGRAMPSLETFANLCEVLDVDPAYILGIKND